MNNSNYQIEKNIVRLTVETALLEMGILELRKVEVMLKEKYDCQIEDCLENPLFLKNILFELFGNAYDDIFGLIKQNLEKIETSPLREKFLLSLKR